MLKKKRSFIILALAIISTFLLTSHLVEGTETSFERYHSFQELTRVLKELVSHHKNIAGLTSLGKTSQGRDIWLVEITNKKTGKASEKQAICICANLEGDHLIGSEVALFTIDYLLSNYGSDEKITRLIDSRTFYIIPRVNPDAAECLFGKVVWGQRVNYTPWDDDFDGTIDEDGPEDLNGDGVITQMRVRDPSGSYITDPREPRLMRKADPAKGEQGKYKLYTEGIDSDGDEAFNEDGPGGVDIDMNFPHNYPYYENGAGRFMVSESESRAVIDFILGHRNIATILTYSLHDNLITPPRPQPQKEDSETEIEFYKYMLSGRRYELPRGVDPSQFRRFFRRKPATNIHAKDVPYYTEVSKRYREITKMDSLFEQPDETKPRGAFFEWGYFQYGVPSFTAKLWMVPELEEEKPKKKESEEEKNEEEQPQKIREMGQRFRPGAGMLRGKKDKKKDELTEDRKWLKWIDTEMNGEGFVDWKPFKHPALGEVEIGGFKPLVKINPPANKIKDIGEKHAQFTVYLAGLLPEVKIAYTEVKNYGGGIFLLKAEVENQGYLPTALIHGMKAMAVKPTLVRLKLNEAKILAGKETNFLPVLDGSGAREKFEWLIQGKTGSKVVLSVISQKGGSDSEEILLK